MVRRLSCSMAFLGALLLAAPGDSGVATAHAKSASVSRSQSASTDAKRRKAKRRRAASRKRLVCRNVDGKRRCKKVGRGYTGFAQAEETLRTEPLQRPSGEIWLYAENFREEVKVNIYAEDGSFNEAALAQLDTGFRCKRTEEERAVDPRLYETLSRIYDHFGKQRITLVSGFRFQRNEGSRHFHAAAMDIRIPGVSMAELYEFANSLDAGGMGIGRYPRSGFVHIDYRAPGEPSYRWIDRTGRNTGRGKSPSRAWKRRPNS